MPETTLLIGDVRVRLKEIPDNSIHCAVTSPPYYSLRDYSVCECILNIEKKPDPKCPFCKGTGKIEEVSEKQLGQESTPQEYVDNLVQVFHILKDKLMDTGCFWLNIGDCYSGAGSGQQETGQRYLGEHYGNKGQRTNVQGIKPKNLIGIPWRVAFAMQNDGWYLRCDNIWAKMNNAMPENVKDRPSRNHEYIFLFSKSEEYFYDFMAVRREAKPQSIERTKYAINKFGAQAETGARLGKGIKGGNPGNMVDLSQGANLRSVWAINPKCYQESHFATFPEELVETCIKAGTSEKGCCPICKEPWARVVEQIDIFEEVSVDRVVRQGKLGEKDGKCIMLGEGSSNSLLRTTAKWRAKGYDHDHPFPPKATLGWQPTCEHTQIEEKELLPCVVLDPFGGSGTVGWVARRPGRDSVLIELNPQYADLIKKRTMMDVPDLTRFSGDG